MSGRVISSTTQEFLDIYDITNNMVIMKDGSVSTILSVYAMNFSLLAEEEQDAVIYAYAALLNSLNYPIQINIQSKTKDATKYLDLLKKQQEKASSKDKAARIGRYQEFVSKLIQERNVLDKKFYVIIPASPIEMGIMSPSSFMSSAGKKNAFDISTIEKSVILEKAAGVLEPRNAHLMGQFNRIGLFAKQLNTQEIIQIFYTNYNPETAEGQQLVESNDYSTPLVRASVFKTSLSDPNPQSTTAPVVEQPTSETSADSVGSSSPTTELINSEIVQESPVLANQSPFTNVEIAETQVTAENSAPPATVVEQPIPDQAQQYTLPPVAEIK